MRFDNSASWCPSVMSYFMKLITNISRKGLKDILQRWHSKLIMKMLWKFLLLACSGLRMRRKSSWSIKVLLCNFAQAFLKIVFFVKSFRRPYLRSSFDKLLQFYIQSYRYIVNRTVLVYSATDAKTELENLYEANNRDNWKRVNSQRHCSLALKTDHENFFYLPALFWGWDEWHHDQ